MLKLYYFLAIAGVASGGYAWNAGASLWGAVALAGGVWFFVRAKVRQQGIHNAYLQEAMAESTLMSKMLPEEVDQALQPKAPGADAINK